VGHVASAAGLTVADVAIRARGLVRRFENVTAVDNLNLEVERGTVFGFLGPNGAGKTTTIRLLLGLVEPTSGSAEILGHEVARQPTEARRLAGVLLEHTGLYERLSAADNLDYFGRLWRMPAVDREARIVELLTHFGLADRRTEIVGTWSRGMKQKVALARALLHRPPVVFLDEPTAGLDPVAAHSLRTDLLTLARREGVTVFVTTHNLDEAERMCDRVGVIRSGRLVAEGNPSALRSAGGRAEVVIEGSRFDGGVAALRARPEVANVDEIDGHRLEVELTGDPPVAPLVRLLIEHGAEIEEVRKGARSLEEAFLSLLEEPLLAEPEQA
jgi:ABC-2 type transport system ATP-binding protein